MSHNTNYCKLNCDPKEFDDPINNWYCIGYGGGSFYSGGINAMLRTGVAVEEAEKRLAAWSMGVEDRKGDATSE